MKAYKGFNQDMTCAPTPDVCFQYEEGKTYETDEAVLCKKGFHACENPLDTLKYYAPGKGSVYHEVELDGVTDEAEDFDSKRCGTKITIGESLSVLDLCKLHFDYTKERTTNNDQGKDFESLAAQNRSSLAAQNRSSLAAQDYSSLAARSNSSLAAQNRSSLAARDDSSLAAQDYSSLAAQDYSNLVARDYSSLAAQDYSSLAARNNSSLAAQDCSSLAARNNSSLAARNNSSLAAQDCSSLAAQDYSSLAAGQNSVIAAFNSRAKGGLGTLIALANRKFVGGTYKVTDFKAAIVDGEHLKPDTWYKLKGGEFVEAENQTP